MRSLYRGAVTILAIVGFSAFALGRYTADTRKYDLMAKKAGLMLEGLEKTNENAIRIDERARILENNANDMLAEIEKIRLEFEDRAKRI